MKVYLDIETSGIYVGEEGKKDARILRITALKSTDAGEKKEVFDTFVACGDYIPTAVQKLTGISRKDLVGAPRISTALKRLKDFIGDSTLVFYNRDFDIKFLEFYGDKYGIKFDCPQMDLLDTVREKLKWVLPSFTIDSLAKHFGISTNKPDSEIIYEIDLKLK